MADNIFKVEIVTPDRIFYEGEVDFIEFNTMEGEVGIYKNHIPMTMVLAPGAVNIHKGEEVETAAVHAGFVEVLGEKVTLLAEIAEWGDEIDLERAEEARKRAEERLSNKDDGLDVTRAEIALRKALTRINVANGR